MPDAIREICDFLSSVKFAAIPANVRQQAKNCILDNIGCAILGAEEGSSRIIGRTRKPLGAGNDATIVRQPGRDSVFNAVLVNSSYVHSIDLSEGVARGVVHPGTVVVPAALAEGESLGASGSAVMHATVLGYEMLIRLGWALGHQPADPIELGDPQLMFRGWFPPAMLGAFGTTIAAGSLRGLNSEQMYQALGICANLIPTSAFEAATQGAMVKSLGCGWSAALGVYAAHLAEQGLTGLTDIIDCVFRKLVDSIDERMLTRDLGTRYEMESIGMKWIAAGPVRSELESALQMVEQHHIRHTDIEKVDILTNARTATLNNANPPNLLACKFSTAYVVAHALIGVPRENFLDEAFTQQAFDNSVWRPVAARICMTVSDDYSKAFETAPNTSRPCTMTIRLKNGQSYTHTVAETKGHSAHGAPPTADYVKKFRMLTSARLRDGNTDLLIDQVGRLDTLDNVRGILDACH